jgi:hypothetical protein
MTQESNKFTVSITYQQFVELTKDKTADKNRQTSFNLNGN